MNLSKLALLSIISVSIASVSSAASLDKSRPSSNSAWGNFAC